MHELYCPTCNSPSQYNFSDYMLMCPFCSATFKLDTDTGQKELYGDHYIVPNTMDLGAVKEFSMEWLRRLHHKPSLADKEYFIIDIQGISLPLWIVSLEGHTSWKGLVQKQRRSFTSTSPTDYLVETGQFRRSYRWAVSARSNICETWGLTRLHQPPEPVSVEWDGFPLDSTLSRGRLMETDNEDKSAYDIRKFFEFKFANGLPILGVQVPEEEALRRAKSHVQLYHYKASCLNVDYLLDHRTELEIAGIQLIHVPFWKVTYMFRPKNSLRHFMKTQEKRLIMDGYGKGVLNGELAVLHKDKVTVNGVVTGAASIFFFLLGALWHSSFFLVALFSLVVCGFSLYRGLLQKSETEEEKLQEQANALSGNARPEPGPTGSAA